MSFHINCVCENYQTCKNAESIVFDKLNETFWDLISYLVDKQWDLEMDGANITKSFCPGCSTNKQQTKEEGKNEND